METVKIHTAYIRLDDFLKFSGLSPTGGQARIAIKYGEVKLNGEVCTVCGKKLFGGEVVRYNGQTAAVAANDS